MGEDTFLSSIRTYVKNSSYTSTFSKDLLAIIETEAKNAGVLEKGVSLQEFMDPWLTRYNGKKKACLFSSNLIGRSGYPILTLIRSLENNSVASISFAYTSHIHVKRYNCMQDLNFRSS